MSRQRHQAVGLAALALTALTACSGSDDAPSIRMPGSAPTTSPSTSPSAAHTSSSPGSGSTSGSRSAPALAVPITNAATARDILLRAAMGKEDQGFPDGWHAYTSDITFAGSLTLADPTHVSGVNFVFSTSKHASYLAFAVADSSGRCAGGLLRDDNTTYAEIISAHPVGVPAGQQCTAQTVATVAGYLD